MAAATGYVTDIGRRKRYRLLTPVGLSRKESLASFDVPKKEGNRKDPDSTKGRIDAYSAMLRADMLAEHIVSGTGVIRVANFEGVNIQMALEGDEGTLMRPPAAALWGQQMRCVCRMALAWTQVVAS